MRGSMPFGMAKQVYGVSESSSWPSPMSYAFNQPGAAANLLGAPMHALAVRVCVLVFLWEFAMWSKTTS